MVIAFVILGSLAVICVLGVVIKTRDYLHIQRLSSRCEDGDKDEPEEDYVDGRCR